MSEVEVAVTADEMEAEIVRSVLASEEIPARIAHRSAVGLPRGWSPVGLGFGMGSFSVRVDARDAERARAIVGAAEQRRPARPHVVVRAVAVLILLGFLASALATVQLAAELLR